MKSIQQVVTEFIRDIMNLDITEGIGTYQKKGQACFNEVICRLTEARIREVDTYVYENPQSRKGWNVEQKDVSRELVTQHGTIRYERRYYRHKKSGERSYLADSLVNVAGGERIEVELAAEMCEYATEHSYEKSAQITCNGNVSRQTVMNRTRKVSGYEIDKCGIRSGTVIWKILKSTSTEMAHLGLRTAFRNWEPVDLCWIVFMSVVISIASPTEISNIQNTYGRG